MDHNTRERPRLVARLRKLGDYWAVVSAVVDAVAGNHKYRSIKLIPVSLPAPMDGVALVTFADCGLARSHSSSHEGK
jgi:hypothetical protein